MNHREPAGEGPTAETRLLVQEAPMWLVYIDDDGGLHYQPWNDLTEVGTLIDGDTGEDMQMIGWTVSAPAA